MESRNKRQTPSKFPTSELGLVTYLNMRGFAPDSRTTEGGHATLYYDRTADLESAVIDYNTKCPTCGISFSEMAKAQAEARKQLIDGSWDWERGKEEMRRGGRT